MIQLYIYIHIPFKMFFSITVDPGYWMWFSVLYSRSLLFIHSTHYSIHLLTPISYSSPPPTLSRLSSTGLFSESASVSQMGSFKSYFRLHI